MKLNKKTDIFIQYIIFGFSFFIIYILSKADSVSFKHSFNVARLPLINAIINSFVFMLITIAIVAIKYKQIYIHKLCMKITLILSALFLVLFLIHVFFSGIIKYGDINHDGIVSYYEKLKIKNSQYLYYFLLSSHIVLATMALPFILLVAYKGLIQDYPIHKKIGNIIYPIWLYIAVTGPIIFWMIKSYY